MTPVPVARYAQLKASRNWFQSLNDRLVRDVIDTALNGIAPAAEIAVEATWRAAAGRYPAAARAEMMTLCSRRTASR
jgi:hypothetical protein